MANVWAYEDTEYYKLKVRVPKNCPVVDKEQWGCEVYVRVLPKNLESVRTYLKKYNIKIETIDLKELSLVSLSDEAKAELAVDKY